MTPFTCTVVKLERCFSVVGDEGYGGDVVNSLELLHQLAVSKAQFDSEGDGVGCQAAGFDVCMSAILVDDREYLGLDVF